MTLAVFDPNITHTSPAGSCLLSLLRTASQRYEIELFSVWTDLEPAQRMVIHKMPVPMKPVFLQSILFTAWSVLFNLLAARTAETRITISTQGGFPFCDICHAHCCHKLLLTRYRPYMGGFWPARAARLVNHLWCYAMEAIAFRRASVIVVPSEGLAAEIAACYGASVSGKLRTIANPVDCLTFQVNIPKQPDTPFTFAFCALGNFEWKGLALILSALASGIPARLEVIGGSDVEIERFRKIADAVGVAERVTFVGMQSDIRPFLWRADAFVFPSVYETFSLVCVQAAAAGLPLIATRLHGVEQVLQPGVSGWQVERNLESIANAMQAAVANRAKTMEMGLRAQTLAQQYDEPAFQEHWMALLATLHKRQAG